jgi:hypothetical protein
MTSAIASALAVCVSPGIGIYTISKLRGTAKLQAVPFSGQVFGLIRFFFKGRSILMPIRRSLTITAIGWTLVFSILVGMLPA